MKLRLSFARMLSSSIGPKGLRFPEMEMALKDTHRQLGRLAACRSLDSDVYRTRVVLRLRNIAEQLAKLGQGRLVFESTETWRTVYEDVLKACQPRRYLSVALIRTDDYWRDAPGENSLEFNYMLVDHGFHVHRVFIIDDFFWPRPHGLRRPSCFIGFRINGSVASKSAWFDSRNLKTSRLL